MKEQKKHVRGSQSAFCDALGGVTTTWGTGCYRLQVIGSYGISAPFPPEIAKVGAENEALYEKYLQSEGIAYEREVVVQEGIVGSAIFSGRMDFWCPEDEIKIRELKSATSANTLKEVIKKGKYKPENLAQLISYMLSKEQQVGLLVYTYYEVDGDKIEPKESREFKAQIADDGTILVDGVVSKYNVADQLRHRYNSAMWILDVVVPPRPVGHADKFKGPCKYCDFAQACNMFDLGLVRTRDEFLSTAETTMGSKNE